MYSFAIFFAFTVLFSATSVHSIKYYESLLIARSKNAKMLENMEANAYRTFEKNGKGHMFRRKRNTETGRSISEGMSKHIHINATNVVQTTSKPPIYFLNNTLDITVAPEKFGGGYNGEGCFWFGEAPICNALCPEDFDYIRSHDGHCTLSQLFSSERCTPDNSFGMPCLNPGGEKHFCCKGNVKNCAWTGRWMSATTAHNMNCRFSNKGRCGGVRCFITNNEAIDYSSGFLTSRYCDTINLFNMVGTATCGMVAWFTHEGRMMDLWYKAE